MIGDTDAAQDLIEQNQLDAVVAFSASNVFYLTGFHSMLAILSKTPSSFAVLPRGGEPAVVIPADEEGLYLTGEYHNKNKHFYGGIFGSARDKAKSEGKWPEIIAKEIKKAGAGKGRIGYDGKIMPENQFEALRKELPGARFVESSNLFERMRMIKTEEELRRMKKSLALLEWSTSAAYKAMREGLTEREFVGLFKSAALTRDPDASFLQLETGFGPRGGMGGGTFPSDNAARRGDVIHFDGGILLEQYSSDMCRCGTLGPATQRTRKIFDTCLAAENKAISMLKPGQKISEIYKATLKTIRTAGFPDYESAYFGHSIGMEAHEWPSFTGEQNMVLEEGMVIMIEIPLYDPKVGAFNTEDCFYITKDGNEYLTMMDRNLYQL